MMVTSTANNMKMSTPKEIASPEDLTSTLFPLFRAQYNIQGTGRPKRMSKMFDPIEDDTAISPNPCFATMTEESKSGIDVPAARTVRPMITTGMPRKLPTIVAQSTKQTLISPIQPMDMKKLIAAHLNVPRL